ncbi:NADP-dependent oxidoreductase [Staphylococcus chromogenes]|nr:NADP-dependent oxidoreductase [Staphylococcus chromogenes]
MTTTTKQWVLASRPVGLPTSDNFRLETAELPSLIDGQVLVRNVVASVDPYMRGRMNDSDSYIPPFELDQPLQGGAVGEVVDSRSEKLPVGTMVQNFHGWEEFAVVNEAEASIVDTQLAPAETYLGALGMPGLTAYVGLTAVGEFREGDAVFVSGAAGAVGQMVGQLAKQFGASRVIGSAGSPEKVQHLLDLGFDAAFNYKDGDVQEQLRDAAPEGIDVYFDNVGGEHLEAAIANLNTFGRVSMCGAIAQYNSTEPTPAPRNLALAIGKCLTLRGFVVGQYAQLKDEFVQRVAPLIASGKVRADFTVREGFDTMPDAFLELFSGGNRGKMVVKF